MGIYEKFGLRQIINGSGKMTVLGASAVSSLIAEAIGAAAMDYVVMEELLIAAGGYIGRFTGAEDGCPTIGAASGMALSTAAVIAGTDLVKIERIPNSDGLKNEIIIQKGHAVNFGADITQMVRIGGGKVVEVGQANEVERAHIEGSITESTAALLYVKSHHAVQKGMQSLATMIAVAHNANLPIIVDAAAEEDFKKYIAMGADIVAYSGGKALGGPTSGFLCGNKRLMEACRKQYKGIGRAMKVGKEAVIGLLTAMEQYEQKQDDSQNQINRMTWLIQQFADVNGVKGRVVQDEAGRSIYRAELEFDEKITGLSAKQITDDLKKGNPGIYTRDYYVNLGRINIDPRPMLDGQEKIVAQSIKEILNGKRG